VYDLSFCLFLAFGVGVWKFGWNYFLSCVGALFGAKLFSVLVEEEIPGHFHPHLKSCIATSTALGGAFAPSWIAFGNVALFELAAASPEADAAMVTSFCVVFAIIFAYSRMLTAHCFPGQVLAACAVSMVASAAVRYCNVNAPSFEDLKIRGSNFKLAVGFLICAGFGAYLLQRIENNESAQFGVPRHEFVRVMHGIMESERGSDVPVESKDGGPRPQDSFVKFVRSMEKRALSSVSRVEYARILRRGADGSTV